MPAVITYSGVLGPYSPITFTRASTATYFNASGVLTTAAVNEGRLDYDPSTLAPLGFLVEEQRTNLFQRSEEFNDAYWTPSAATVTANSTTAPTNTNVADTLTEDTSTGQHTLGSSTIAWIGNTQYTATFFAKSNGRTRFDILFGTAGNWVNSERVAQFDLSNGTVFAPPGTPAVASIQSIGNGWYRCRITATTTAAPTASGVFIRLCDATGSSSYTGNGTSGIFLFGAQVEAGAFPTSYIPTTTTALTRSADVASVNTLSPWFNATEGTLFAEYSRPFAIRDSFVAELSDNTFNEFMAIYTDSVPNIIVNIRDGGSPQAAMTLVSGAGVANTLYKQTFAYKTNDFAACSNGGIVQTDTLGTLPTVNRLNMGNFNGGTQILNGWLRRATYYPRRLPDAQLQAITA